ncbi:MAG: sulfotransferase [Caulobacteraceae bacterium]|nr:sulfotransferase [Caulobacteraceae bacterium]
MGEAQSTGDLATALRHAASLLGEQPALAEAQAREILAAVQGHPQARLLLASSLRRQRRANEALAEVEPLIRSHDDWAAAHMEAGLSLALLGQGDAAIAALRKAVRQDSRLVPAWRGLAEQLALIGDETGAEQARAAEIRASVSDPVLLKAGQALVDNDLPVAERLLRDYLKRDPFSVPAIRMLAEVGGRLGRLDDAEKLLTRAVELAPGFAEARHNYAIVLHRQNRPAEAVAQVDQLLARDPDNPAYRILKAAALVRIGEYEAAADLYAAVLKAHPRQAKTWMSHGHVLKTIGRQEEAVAAYREATQVAPNLGEAWWSLANLKTWRFTPGDVELIKDQLQRADLSQEDRLHLEFALGKALEDAGDYAASFSHYARGAAIRRAQVVYEPAYVHAHVERSQALFTREFFAAREGQGVQDPDPIFIVGLPRAGSTLVEQILSSHSQVEGTQELPDIIALARRIGGGMHRGPDSRYPEALAELDAAGLRALGEEYLERTRIQRKTDRPFFIDKMPNNFAHIGLIQLALPKARIIDARRHPMACCFSAFKQHFARGQAFTYDLEELGRYYADYVALMAHFDAVLPGRTHRVIYEDMVVDAETQTRALLDYCGLPFEPACLRFHETDRPVRTASSEQVRKPIFTEGLEQWKHFEPWLDPLKQGLGPALERWRN